MSSGVAVARKGRARGSQLEFPYYLIQMSRSRAQRGARNSVAKKLAQALHVSQSTVRTDLLPTFEPASTSHAGGAEVARHPTG